MFQLIREANEERAQPLTQPEQSPPRLTLQFITNSAAFKPHPLTHTAVKSSSHLRARSGSWCGWPGARACAGMGGVDAMGLAGWQH